MRIFYLKKFTETKRNHFLYSRYTFGDNSTAVYHVGVLIDPLSDTAQKLLSLVEVREYLTSQ